MRAQPLYNGFCALSLCALGVNKGRVLRPTDAEPRGGFRGIRSFCDSVPNRGFGSDVPIAKEGEAGLLVLVLVTRGESLSLRWRDEVVCGRRSLAPGAAVASLLRRG